MGKTKREREREGLRGEAGAEWFASYLQDIRATGHRDSYDSSPFPGPRRLFCARPSRCFCSVLPAAFVLVQRPVALLPPRDRSSAFFFFTVPSFFLLGHRQRALIPAAPLISCPCFHSVRVLLFSSRSMSPSPSLSLRFSLSLRPFLPLLLLLFLPFLPLALSRARPSRVLVHFAR